MTHLEICEAALRAHLALGNELGLTPTVSIRETPTAFELIREIDEGEESDPNNVEIVCSGTLSGCLARAATDGLIEESDE